MGIIAAVAINSRDAPQTVDLYKSFEVDKASLGRDIACT